MKRVYILGAGPSLAALENDNIEDTEDIILINDHSRTVANDTIIQKLKGKNLYILSNVTQEGFNAAVFDKINIKQCVTNRFKPDWDLWQKHKDAQLKHHQGGTLNNLEYLPYLAEDEPYLYTWRGPPGKNLDEMKTRDGRPIEHMPEEAEPYIIPIYKDKLICNCSYFATLYAILKLNAEHIVYYGLDFYSNLKFKKSWYTDPPAYGTPEWWTARIAYEGEHMKVLYDDYLVRSFPDITLEFFTLLDHSFKSTNIKCNTIKAEIASQTWYSGN